MTRRPSAASPWPSRITPTSFRLTTGRPTERSLSEPPKAKKLAAAVLGSSVAFEVDALDEATHTGWSIVVKGTAKEPERLEDYLQAEDLGIEPWADGTKSRFIQIDPSHVTGREIPLTT